MRGPVIVEAIPPPPPPPPKKEAPPEKTKDQSKQKKASGLLLASYTTKAAAAEGWAEIKKQHTAVLGSLQPHYKPFKSGNETHYHLVAGPVASRNAAVTLCGKLKNNNQFCQPMTL
ncbi:MAG: hypothetical protein FD149_1830 [Rhodospirillaceae bacterium]|nr:MAG: hypothetical protein FD149_1830 [Rhodospirillaceae bacterium]